MRKAYYKKIFLFFLIVCLFLFNSGCGLDVFMIIDAPTSVANQPTVYNAFDSRYFEFYTNEVGETAFTGTAVYYKIYNSSSRLSSDVSALTTIANDTQNNYNAPYRLIDNYGYKILRADGAGNSILIPYEGVNQKVYIRLSDYKGMDAYSAQIRINDSYIGDGKTIPLRDVASKATFNFGSQNVYDKIPASDDADVKYTSGSGEDGVWYVAMFALAVGHDTTYSPLYSNILYLGSVKIEYSDQR